MNTFIKTWGWTLLMPIVVVPAIVSTAYRRYHQPPPPMVESVPESVASILRRDLQAMATEVRALKAELLARSRQDPVETAAPDRQWWASNANNIGFRWLSRMRTNSVVAGTWGSTLSTGRTNVNVPAGAWRWELNEPAQPINLPYNAASLQMFTNHSTMYIGLMDHLKNQ